MFSIHNYDYDCTKKCKNLEHGKTITHAITKKSISNEKLIAFIAKTCKNFTDVIDYEGRSGLHLACSVGRYKIAEWLILYGANLNLKDKESAQTPLHRAIFYGYISIAVLLLRYGAQFDLPDDNFKIPIQYCFNSNRTNNSDDEVFLWGKNKNNNLGIGIDLEKPESLTYFNKTNIYITQVSMSTYHTIFLSERGNVFTIGHGIGGRLGIGVENSTVLPKLVKISFKNPGEIVSNISAGKNHSLILTNFNIIYSTGLNDYGQLGHKLSIEKLLSFKYIGLWNQFSHKKFSEVIAHECYSLAYNVNELIVWGFNKGQFGEIEKNNPTLPKQLSINNHKIECLDSNEFAIVFYTATKNLFIFHKFKGKTYRSPGLETIKSLSCAGGSLNNENSQKNHETLRIIALTKENNIYIWYEDVMKYIKCSFPVIRYLPIDKIFWCSKQIILLSDNILYSGTTIKQNSKHIELSKYKETYSRKDICEESKIKIDLKRVSQTSRVSNIFIDKYYENFAILQEKCERNYKTNEYWNDVPNFENLLNESNESDSIHDIVLVVDQRRFPVHKFIIYNRAQGLIKFIKKSKEKVIHLNIESLNASMFEVILKCIYFNWIPDSNDIRKIQSITPDSKNMEKETIKSLKKILIQFGLNYNAEAMLKAETKSFPRFKRTNNPELYDVIIKCADNEIIYAHKCVLVSRLEYFNMMFNHSWDKTNEVNFSTMPIELIEQIIDYLYSYDFTKYQTEQISDSFFFTMITICDQYFVEQLKYNFEVLITERLTIKNCGDILEFASLYNCPQLEKTSMEFICSNIARILEFHSLDNLDIEILEKIDKYYRATYHNMLDYRVITPYFDAVDDEILESFITDFNVDFEPKHTEIKTKPKLKIKENRLTIDRRQYEKQAINCLKILSIDEQIKNNDNKSSKQLNNETKLVAEQKEIELKYWTKVPEKKEVKNKMIVAGIKVNEIVKNEPKLNDQFVNINSFVKSPTQPISNESNSWSKFNSDDLILQTSNGGSLPKSELNRSFNFSDFAQIKNGKLSQKQRKRISSETMLNNPCTSSSLEIVNNLNESPTVVENVWNIPKTPPTNPINILSTRKSQNHDNSPTFSSYSDIVVSPSYSSPTENDFFTIIADERKQKQYFEKTKFKSLALTQLEEEAIEDLKKFYNVDNVFDETITISRKSKMEINVAVWKYNQKK